MAKITRIKASDSEKIEEKAAEPVITREKVVLKDKKLAKNAKKEAKKEAKLAKKAEKKDKKVFILFRPFVAIGHYLKESWQELRQVRWPNRKTTWKLVIAILIYSALFIVLIVLLDSLFTMLFNLILK